MVRWPDTVPLAYTSHLGFFRSILSAEQVRKLRIAETRAFGVAQQPRRNRLQREGAQAPLKVQQIDKLMDEPGIVARQPGNCALFHPTLERITNIERPVRVRRDQPLA